MINEIAAQTILQLLKPSSLVLDIGGARFPWFRANYILDKRTYKEKVGPTAFQGSNDNKEYFSKKTWISHDFYDLPWPFPDKYFDFSLCMGTLEDLRDPIAICKEIQRVSKAGYISTPTRAAECCKGISNHPDSNHLYGYFHHRWFVEIIKGELVFKYKTPLLYQHKQWLLAEYLQHTLQYFWKDHFKCSEEYLAGHNEAINDLQSFYNKHNQLLKQNKNTKIYNHTLYNNWVNEWGPIPNFLSMDHKLKKKDFRTYLSQNSLVARVKKFAGI